MYVYMYPTARGNPATGPTNASQDDRQTIQNRPSWDTNPVQNRTKWKENWSKNHPSWDKKSFKNRTKWEENSFKIAPKRPLGGVWGGLEANLAPRWPQEAKNLRKSISGAPSWEACWDLKSQKIAPKRDPKSDDFLVVFGIGFWSHFGPT